MNPFRCPARTDMIAGAGGRCQKPRWHPAGHFRRTGGVSAYWSRGSECRETFETDAPWVTWTWLSTDRETRVTGRMRMRLTCCVCGRRETVRARIPRWGPVPEPEGGRHPVRLAAIVRHAHPDQRDPADWALPLRNWEAWQGGVPLGVFERIAETAQMEDRAGGG